MAGQKRKALFFAFLFVLFLGTTSVFAQDPSEDMGCAELLTDRSAEIQNLIQEYTQLLTPYEDPFAIAFSPEQGERIFQSLLVRMRNGQPTRSGLYWVNEALKKNYSGHATYNSRLIQWVIADARLGFEKSNGNRQELQSRLLGLKYSLEYLRRFKLFEEKTSDSTEDKEEVQKTDDKAEAEPEEKYPELPEDYTPKTDDSQKKDGQQKQKPFLVTSANLKTAYFGQRYFGSVVRGQRKVFQKTILPTPPSPPGRFAHSDRILKVYPKGETHVVLFVPPGMKPLQPSDTRAVVSKDESETYHLRLKEPLQEVQIPLVPDVNIKMLSHIREIYQRPVGFADQEWPDLIRAEVLNKFSRQDAQQNPLKVAQALANHIALEYLYSVGSRPETDPIQALKAGAFQCDMAAYIMMGVLRDVYEIPSRVVAGFRAKSKKGDVEANSYLVLPGEAHAWVEVFHDGRWHTFDATPLKKDSKEEDQEKEAQEYQDISPENVPAPDSEDRNKDENFKEKLEKDTKDRIEKHQEQAEKDLPKEDQEEPIEESVNELADQLELGSIDLEPKSDRNPLLDRAMRILLRKILDPTRSGADISNQLNQVLTLSKRFPTGQFRDVIQSALTVHEKNHPEIKSWIEQVVRTMPTQDVNKSFMDIFRIKGALEVYARTLDANGKIPMPHELLQTLARVEFLIRKLAHADAQDIGLVNDMVKDLSSVARTLLREKYGLQDVGPNAPTRQLAADIKSGQMRDLRLMGLLGLLSDFILNSTPRPEYVEVKTWVKDNRRSMGRDLLPLQRYSDMSRALLGQPGKSLEDNIREGTAFIPTRRQRIHIPAGHGKDEAERITILLYDTSGSMSGDPGRFQAGLISAFTDRALSDVSGSGKHRHKVLIIPFDDDPGAPIPVSNTEQALDVIRNYRSKLANTGGGTNIQKALLQAMSLIADAEKRNGEALAAANIVLMTDGQAQIDKPELFKARKSIDRNTPLQTMFIAINQTSPDLMDFAMDSKSMGVEHGFYREFASDLISEVLKNADNVNLDKTSEFYSDKTAGELPQEIYFLMDKAMKLAATYSDQIYYGSRYASSKEHLEELEKLRWRDVEKSERPMETWLIKVRQFASNPIFRDRRLLEVIVDDLVLNFEKITGLSKEMLVGQEQEQLRHLIRYAAGLEDLSW